MSPYDNPLETTLNDYVQLLFAASPRLLSSKKCCLVTKEQKIRLESVTDHSLMVHLEPLDDVERLEFQALGLNLSGDLFKLYYLDVWTREYQRLEAERVERNRLRQEMLAYYEVNERRRKEAIEKLSRTMKCELSTAKNFFETLILTGQMPEIASLLGVDDLVQPKK